MLLKRSPMTMRTTRYLIRWTKVKGRNWCSALLWKWKHQPANPWMKTMPRTSQRLNNLGTTPDQKRIFFALQRLAQALICIVRSIVSQVYSGQNWSCLPFHMKFWKILKDTERHRKLLKDTYYDGKNYECLSGWLTLPSSDSLTRSCYH